MQRNLAKFEQLLARGATSSGRKRSSSQSGSGDEAEENEEEGEEAESSDSSSDSSSDDEGGSEYVITGKFGAMKITGGGKSSKKLKMKPVGRGSTSASSSSSAATAEFPGARAKNSASRAFDDSFVGSRTPGSGSGGGRQKPTCITMFRAKPKGLGLPSIRMSLADPSEKNLHSVAEEEATSATDALQLHHEIVEQVLQEEDADESEDEVDDEPLFASSLLARCSPFARCVPSAAIQQQTAKAGASAAVATQPATPAIHQSVEILAALPADRSVSVNTSGMSSAAAAAVAFDSNPTPALSSGTMRAVPVASRSAVNALSASSAIRPTELPLNNSSAHLKSSAISQPSTSSAISSSSQVGAAGVGGSSSGPNPNWTRASGAGAQDDPSRISSTSFSSASYAEDDDFADDLLSTLSDTLPPLPTPSPQHDSSRRAVLRSMVDELDASARTAIDATSTPLKTLTNSGQGGTWSASTSPSSAAATRTRWPASGRASSENNTPTLTPTPKRDSPPQHPLLLAEKSARSLHSASTTASAAASVSGGSYEFAVQQRVEQEQPADLYENFARAPRSNSNSNVSTIPNAYQTSTSASAPLLPTSALSISSTVGSQSSSSSNKWSTPPLASPSEESDASFYSNTMFLASGTQAPKSLEPAPYYLSSTSSSTLGTTSSSSEEPNESFYSNASFTSPSASTLRHKQSAEPAALRTAASDESGYYTNFTVSRMDPLLRRDGQALPRERVIAGASGGGGSSLAANFSVPTLETRTSFASPTATGSRLPPPAGFSDASPARGYNSPSPTPAPTVPAAMSGPSQVLPCQPAANDIYLPASSPARLTSAPTLSISAPVVSPVSVQQQLVWRDPAPLSAPMDGPVAFVAPPMASGPVREPPPVFPKRSVLASRPS